MFATLSLALFLPSHIGVFNLPLMLLYDFFANLAHSLTSFLHWFIASLLLPPVVWQHHVFCTLSLTLSLPCCVSVLTLPLVLLFDFFAALLCSLTSFSCWFIVSSTQSSGNVMLAMISLALLLPSQVSVSTLSSCTSVQLLCCSLMLSCFLLTSGHCFFLSVVWQCHVCPALSHSLSQVGASTLPLMLLFDFFCSLMLSFFLLMSVIASSSQSSGNIMFAALTLALLLPPWVGAFTCFCSTSLLLSHAVSLPCHVRLLLLPLGHGECID